MLNRQVDQFARVVRADSELHRGFNALGFSQGNTASRLADSSTFAWFYIFQCLDLLMRGALTNQHVNYFSRGRTHEKLRSSGATSTSTMIHLWTPSCLYMVFWWVWMGCQTVHWHLGSVAFWHRSSHMWVYILRLCKIIWHRPTISGTLPIWRHTELHVISCHSSTMRFRGQGTRIQSTKATLSRFRNWCLSWRKMTAWCTQRRVSTLATSRMALALSWWLCVMHLGTKMTGSDWRAWTRQRRSTFIPRQVITFVSVRQHFWDVLCFAVKFAGQR